MIHLPKWVYRCIKAPFEARRLHEARTDLLLDDVKRRQDEAAEKLSIRADMWRDYHHEQEHG
jgi:hypothetical protein